MFAGRCCDLMAGALNGEQHVIAAAHHLVMALEAKNNFTDDVRKLLSDLNTHLSQMVKLSEAESRNLKEIETRLVSAQNTITTLHSTHPKIWDSGPLTIYEYLQAIDVVQRSAASLNSTPLLRGTRSKELFDRTQDILQPAMARLQKELIHILVQNKQCFGHEFPSTTVCETSRAFDESFVSNEDDSLDNASLRASSSTATEEDTVMDLIHPDVIPQIKSIANTMFNSGYDQEFRHTFTAFWRNTLAEYLDILDVEQLSIEDVVRMEWKSLNWRIKAWCSAIKRIVGMYLTSAKRLFDQILGERGCESSVCLMEASKASLLCLLNFGQAVSIGPHKPEWLFCLLDMYEALASVIVDVDALYPGGIGSSFKIEFQDLLIELGNSIRVIFKGFGNHIAGCVSTAPYANGGIHPLTTYVMNYISYIAEYGCTLKSLLQTQDTENSNGAQSSDDVCSVVGAHLRPLTSILEDNLCKKSSLYKDHSLKHIFMMNNLHYMVEKIKSSAIRPYFGDDWIRCYIVKFRQQERLYERDTLGPMVPLLGEAEKAGKAELKARCQAFTAAFDEMHKNQTRWCVPDIQLREELKISVSRTLILAYRNFANAVNNSIGEKNLKYSEQDLAMYILDLLEGSSKSMSHLRKR